MIQVRKAALVAVVLLTLGGCSGGLFKSKPKTPVLGNRVPILSTEAGALADPTIASIAVSLPPAQANAAWSQPGGSANKSMGHLTLGSSLSRAWSVKVAGSTGRARLASQPVVADGRVYLVDVDAVVTAYSAETGAKQWSTQVSDQAEKSSRGSLFGGGVSYVDGKLFATSGLGDVVALNAADGSVIWRVKPGGPLRGAPGLANGLVFVVSQDSQLYALSQAEGKVEWTQAGSMETQGILGVASPAAAQGTIVAGFSSGELNAYRYENGRMLWQDTLSRTSATTSVSALSDIDAEPVIDGGRVYSIGQGGRLVAIDLGTGQRLWEQNFASISTPWIASEWLFVVTDDARLIAVARASGRIRWIAQLQRYRKEKSRKGLIQWSGPILAGDRLLLTNSRGQVVSASPADGSILSTMETKTAIDLPPVVANNTLFLVGADGRLSAYR